MNVQIYIEDKSCNLTCLSQDEKREIWFRGLMSKIKDENDLKIFIVEHNFFGINKIQENKIFKEGREENVNFSVFVDCNYKPNNQNEIYCLVSDRAFTSDHLGNTIKVNSIISVNHSINVKTFQNDRSKSGINEKKIFDSIKDMLDLFIKGAPSIGEIIEQKHLDAVDYLEKMSGERV